MRFNILGRIRIRARLIIGLGILVLMLVYTGVMWRVASKNIIKGLYEISEVHYPLAEASMEMQMAIIQIQQYFTDLSLSGAQKDEKEANRWKDHFTKYAQKASEVAVNDKMKKQIADIMADFDKYFKMADVMSKIYAAEEDEAGSSIKVDVDAFVEILRGKINNIVSLTKANMIVTLGETKRITSTTATSNNLLTLMMSVISIVLALMLANSITSPINDIIVRLRAIAEESVADLSKSINVESNDEISEVGQLFNQFVGKIRTLIVRLADMAEHLASATTQLSATTEQFSGQARSQADQVNHITRDIEEVNKAVANIASRAVDVARTSTETHSLALDGGKVITNSSDAIKKLSDYSSKIGNILLVIEDIAKKTDLLAINAAIEAANAGDQGKGFAVVAEEVRKLAERTTRSIGEISRMIQDIQTFTSEAVDSMKHSSQVMSKIIIEATQVNQMIDEIAASTEKQSGITSGMLKNVRSVHELSQGFAEQAEQSEQVANEINDQSLKLQNVVDEFNVNSR